MVTEMSADGIINGHLLRKGKIRPVRPELTRCMEVMTTCAICEAMSQDPHGTNGIASRRGDDEMCVRDA